MWTDTYKKNAELLRGSNGKKLHDQMKRLTKESPEIVAAINFLALALAEKIEKSNQNGDGDGVNIINIIPKIAVDFALSTQLVLPIKDEICDKLNKWATHIWFEKLRRGILEEPEYFC